MSDEKDEVSMLLTKNVFITEDNKLFFGDENIARLIVELG